MNSNTFRRSLAGAAVIAGALTLTACNSDAPDVDSTGSETSTAAPTNPGTGDPTGPTSDESSETSSDNSSDSSSDTQSETSSDTSSETSTGSDDGPTEVTDAKATLKMGQPAVIEKSDDTFRLTPKSMEVAPDSVFSETSLKKSNGTVYFLKFDVTAIKTNSTYFGTNSVNGLFFHPEIDAGVTGAKRVYGRTADCESDSKKLAPGESGSSCYIYQVPGKTVSNVVYNDSDHRIRWTK